MPKVDRKDALYGAAGIVLAIALAVVCVALAEIYRPLAGIFVGACLLGAAFGLARVARSTN